MPEHFPVSSFSHFSIVSFPWLTAMRSGLTMDLTHFRARLRSPGGGDEGILAQ
jgi:hypothetical protein